MFCTCPSVNILNQLSNLKLCRWSSTDCMYSSYLLLKMFAGVLFGESTYCTMHATYQTYFIHIINCLRGSGLIGLKIVITSPSLQDKLRGKGYDSPPVSGWYMGKS